MRRFRLVADASDVRAPSQTRREQFAKNVIFSLLESELIC